VLEENEEITKEDQYKEEDPNEKEKEEYNNHTQDIGYQK